MAKDVGSLGRARGNEAAVRKIQLERYVLRRRRAPHPPGHHRRAPRPGRDPRDTFEAPTFRTDVQEVKDLQKGMKLEGVVTNVVAFGAFVDVGVHQDGLVHVSQLADRFVKDPSEVVTTPARLPASSRVSSSASPRRSRIRDGSACYRRSRTRSATACISVSATRYR
jgi:protein Tex